MLSRGRTALLKDPFTARIDGYTRKIDNAEVGGLAGVPDSLAYITDEIHKHLHNVEYWFGDGGSDDLSRTSANFITITAGTSFGYGTEVKIHSGGVLVAGWVKADFRRMLIKGVTVLNKVYTIQIWQGGGAFGDATLLTENEIYFPAGTKADPLEFISNRFIVTNNLWARCRCETNGGDLEFRPGIHGYVG